MKKKITAVLCTLILLSIVGTGTAFAYGTTGKAVWIGSEKAKTAAYRDAGVDSDAVRKVQIEFESEKGQLVYDVEFIADGTEYDYWIDAFDGTVIKKKSEQKKAAASSESRSSKTKKQAAAPAKKADSAPRAKTAEPAAVASTGDRTSYIGVDQAKSAALLHAGVEGSQASFFKAKLDKEDGRMIYEIEFYVGRTEYEYEIDAFSGAVLDHDVDYD